MLIMKRKKTTSLLLENRCHLRKKIGVSEAKILLRMTMVKVVMVITEEQNEVLVVEEAELFVAGMKNGCVVFGEVSVEGEENEGGVGVAVVVFAEVQNGGA